MKNTYMAEIKDFDAVNDVTFCYMSGLDCRRRQKLLGKNKKSIIFYARMQLLLSARPSHRNSVRLSVTWVDQSKPVQARITLSSPLAAWKTLVSGTVKHFRKFKGGHPERGR